MYLGRPPSFHPRRFVGAIARWFNFLLIPLIVWRGVRLVRSHSIRIILTLPWNEYFIAAYFIHLLTAADLCVWVMDDPHGGRRWYDLHVPLYSALFGAILRRARWVWGISPYLCEYLNRRYNCASQLLMPFLDDSTSAESTDLRPRRNREIHIVHTGAIYTLQVDAVRNMVGAVTRANAAGGGTGYRLTLLCSLSPETLKRMGLDSPNVAVSPHVPPGEIPRFLSEADILFIGYSFDARIKHMASTSLATKLTEYLASGVPILVHAPPYASISRYCKSEGFGLLVEEPDEKKLAEAILRLATDSNLRERLARNATATFLNNHVAATARARFFQSLCA